MRQLGDFGPLYAETDLSATIVEPLNALSNVVFLVLFIYWGRKTRFSFREYPFIVFSLWILLIGFVGGTVYHATRSHSIWLILDFVPIGVLCFATAVKLWRELTKSMAKGFLLTLAVIATPRILFRFFTSDINLLIMVGYASLAFAILLPAYLSSYRRAWEGVGYLHKTVGVFAIALFCRTFDKHLIGVSAIGSHFLWHLLGGVSVHYLICYLMGLSSKQTGDNEE